MEEQIPSLRQNELLYLLASCHSLSVLHGELIGDPLEKKMLEATQWALAVGESNAVIDVCAK